MKVPKDPGFARTIGTHENGGSWLKCQIVTRLVFGVRVDVPQGLRVGDLEEGDFARLGFHRSLRSNVGGLPNDLLPAGQQRASRRWVEPAFFGSL